MKYLLDTNICIYIIKMRNQEKAYRRFFDRPFDGRVEQAAIPTDW